MSGDGEGLICVVGFVSTLSFVRAVNALVTSHVSTDDDGDDDQGDEQESQHATDHGLQIVQSREMILNAAIPDGRGRLAKRKTDTNKQRQTETGRDRLTDWDRHGQTDKVRQTDGEKQTDKEKQTRRIAEGRKRNTKCDIEIRQTWSPDEM